MKLLRYGPVGEERPALLDELGEIRDLGTYRGYQWQILLPATLYKLRQLDSASLPLVRGEQRLGACVGHVGKFICVGLNYADHAAETGQKSRKNR